jgi:fatty-acyl-CoA synthase
LSAALETTETFKQKKQDLVRAGFDPRTVADPLFFREAKSGDFLTLDTDQHARLVRGAIRL